MTHPVQEMPSSGEAAVVLVVGSRFFAGWDRLGRARLARTLAEALLFRPTDDGADELAGIERRLVQRRRQAQRRLVLLLPANRAGSEPLLAPAPRPMLGSSPTDRRAPRPTRGSNQRHQLFGGHRVIAGFISDDAFDDGPSRHKAERKQRSISCPPVSSSSHRVQGGGLYARARLRVRAYRR